MKKYYENVFFKEHYQSASPEQKEKIAKVLDSGTVVKHMLNSLDCSKEAVDQRRKWVRSLLEKYKKKTASEAEKSFLISQIQTLMSYAEDDKSERCHQIICLYYISPTPMTIRELCDEYFISKATVFDSINSAINDLTVVIFGLEGMELTSFGRRKELIHSLEFEARKAAQMAIVDITNKAKDATT